MASQEQLLAQADRCFVEEEYEEAVQHYTEALKAEPSSARVFESRAHARLKLEQWLEASEDATKAIELDPHLPKAYLRKGVALFQLEEYEAAKEVLEAGAALVAAQAPEAAGSGGGGSGGLANQFRTWLRKCRAELEDEEESAQPAKQAKQETAPAPVPAAIAAEPASAPAPAAPHADGSNANGAPAAALTSGDAAASAPAASTSTFGSDPLAPAAAALAATTQMQGKYRYQHYQLASKVTVDVYAKKLRKEQVVCVFGPQHLSLVIKDAEGKEEEFNLDIDLYGKVHEHQCKCEVLSTKVEVTLVKADNLQWPTLEKSNKVAVANYSTLGTDAPVKYPTSAPKKKDWSKVETEIKTLEEKGELDDGDPLNNFFKKIFAGGDEDTRRAMMKSFVESNGTVLSTNWKEVGAKKVECTPPEGMEVKHWNKE